MISLIGCEKQKQDEPTYSLIGEWTWISSCGGFSYHCISPESSNHTVKITFSTDSLYNVYQDGILIQSEKFQTLILPPADMPGTPNVIKYGQNIITHFAITHDTLSLNDVYADGFLSLYKRAK
jgi:hypothetical protein